MSMSWTGRRKLFWSLRREWKIGLVLQHDSDSIMVDRHGNTALMRVIGIGQRVFQRLIDYCCNFNAPNEYGNTALIELETVEILRLLLDRPSWSWLRHWCGERYRRNRTYGCCRNCEHRNLQARKYKWPQSLCSGRYRLYSDHEHQVRRNCRNIDIVTSMQWAALVKLLWQRLPVLDVWKLWSSC